jgi:acetyl-CoA carboxylase biotin carboxyl carrier protein
VTEPKRGGDAAERRDVARDHGGDARELLALVDRLGTLLDDNDLAELEVEAEGTRVVLRRGGEAAAAAREPAHAVAVAEPTEASRVGADDLSSPAADAGPTLLSVVSPLTGIFYSSPAPGSAPYVQVGGEVAVGQVIGLVEAMKLFNEIKSQVAGRVVRVVAETGALVKAKQPLIEVEPV